MHEEKKIYMPTYFKNVNEKSFHVQEEKYYYAP